MKPCQHGCCLAGTAGQADCFTSLMPLSCALAALTKCTLTLQSCLPLTEEMEPKFVTHQIYTNLFYLPVIITDFGPVKLKLPSKSNWSYWKLESNYLTNCAWGYHSHQALQPLGDRSVIFLGDNWPLRKVQLPDESVWCLGPKR